MAKATKTKTSLSGSGTKYESIKDLHPKPDPSKLVPIKDAKPKDKYEPRYVTASKPQGKSKTEIVPIKDYTGGKKTKTGTVNPDNLVSIQYAPGNKTRIKTPKNPSTVGVGSATRTRKRFE